MKWQLFIAFNFLLLWVASLQGQEKAIWLHQLDESQGLPVLNTSAIFQDAEGFIWIASLEGLYRFDGRNVRYYASKTGDPFALKDNLVTGNFFADKAKNFWFCTHSAIQCYQRKFDRFSQDSIVDQRGLAIRENYFAFHLERDSFLWLRAGNRGIYRFDIHNRQAYGPLANTTMDIDIFPGVNASGKLKYAFAVNGTNGAGLEFFTFDENGQLAYKEMLFDGADKENPSLFLHKVIYQSDTLVWLSANEGIVKWNPRSGKHQLFSTGRNSKKEIVALNQNELLISERRNGLFRFHTKSEQFLPVAARLINNPEFELGVALRKLYRDSMGNIWITLADKGLVFGHSDKVKMRAIPKSELWSQRSNFKFRTMVQDQAGDIWCSSYFDGIFKLSAEGALLTHFHSENPTVYYPHSNQINHLFIDHSENLWVATKNGVLLYHPATNRFQPVLDPTGNAVPYPVFFYQLQEDTLLVSTLQKGIFQVAKRGDKYHLKELVKAGDSNDFHTTIYQDSLGSIYVSHKLIELQVFNYIDGNLRLLTQLPVSGNIQGFFEANDGKSLWIATSSGLVCLDKTSLSSPPVIYGKEEGLQFTHLQGLAPDNKGNLWMSSISGLVRYQPDGGFTHFSLADGMQSSLFDELAVLSHRDSSLWFGGSNGITIVDPADLEFIETTPKVRITEVRVNDESTEDLFDVKTGATNPAQITKLRQGHRFNTLSFLFTALDYSDPGATQLQYYMEGLDRNWVQLEQGEPGFARYPNIPAGNYVFKVRAANSDGRWSEEQSLLRLTVLPPWYETWWFRTLAGLGIAGILFGFYRLRINQIRRKEAFLRSESEFKQKEAEYKQLVAETETAVLRLQMNPHFIYNSMNSISGYIIEKDIATANDYLSRFAKLMRMILKFGEQPLLTIAKEVELLQLYTATEAMRFENKFETIIEVAPEIDPDEVLIPTMILQPFVENAILHGLRPKKGKGWIKIAFWLKGDKLFCRVEDNGVGRKVAAQNNKGQYESRATTITRRRLQLLENQAPNSTSLQIEDLTNFEQKPTGTRVEIELPLL